MIENIEFDDTEKWVVFKSQHGKLSKTVGYTGKIEDIEVSMFVLTIGDALLVSIVDQISGFGLALLGLSVEDMFKCDQKDTLTEVLIDKMIHYANKLNDDIRHEIEKKRYENIILDEPKPLSIEELIGMGFVR